MEKGRQSRGGGAFGSLVGEDEMRRAAEALRLTPRQAEVVGCVLRAMKDKQIATELGLSVATVRMHLRHAFARVGAADRMELALRVMGAVRGGGGADIHSL